MAAVATPTHICGRQFGDRLAGLAVVRGSDGIDEPVEDPAVLEPAGFADGLDTFDPTVPAV